MIVWISVPTRLAVALSCTALLAPSDADAYRMIYNASTGRTSFASSVTCDDARGFAHWAQATIPWRFSPANQGAKAGMEAAFQSAMAGWNAVTPAGYWLSYTGTTNAGFATDGTNTVLWATGNGCTGGCLAITAIVLASGQVITEADVAMNNAAIWNANGSDYDAQAILAHELGHTLGIHHTEVKQKRNRPTMYAYYFGTEGRSQESDDRAALNCAYTRYPPPSGFAFSADPGPTMGAGEEPILRPLFRPGAAGASLRFELQDEETVRLDLFDVAGRHLANLVDQSLRAGEHEIAWDGTTRFGRARPGVYFARIRTPRGSTSATVVLAR